MRVAGLKPLVDGIPYSLFLILIRGMNCSEEIGGFADCELATRGWKRCGLGGFRERIAKVWGHRSARS